MKKRLAVLFLCTFILLCLCACTFSVSGEYYSESEHKSETLASERENGSIEDFYNLRSAIANCVKERKSSESLVVKNYKGDLKADLNIISNEISNTLPIGLYAVESFYFEERDVQSKHEVYIEMSYKRSGIEMAQVSKADNSVNFESDLSYSFSIYQEKEAFLFNNFTDAKEDFEERVLKCWLGAGVGAMPIKEAKITNFPDYSKSRIVEIKLKYDESATLMLDKKRELGKHLEAVCNEHLSDSIENKLSFVQSYIAAHVTRIEDARKEPLQIYATTESDTAYGALLGGGASDVGVAAATAAMCKALNMKARVMYGEKAAKPYAWVYLEDSNLVIDALGDGTQYLLPVKQAQKLFNWNEKVYSFE